MDMYLPQNILNDLFTKHEDERDRLRAGIPSVMQHRHWESTSYRRRVEIGYKSRNKRKYGNKFKLLKF